MPKERLTNKETKVDQEEKKLLRGVIGQLNWLAGITRPNISYNVCEASTKVKDATIADVLNVDKIVRKVKNELSEIHFLCFDPRSLHIRRYSDASFNNLPNGCSQGGHIVFLCGSSDRGCPLTWSSTKMKRVVRSTLAAETLSLVESSETAIYLSKVTGACVNGSNHPMEICSITDNLSLFEAVYTIKPVSDRRLCLEISAVCQMWEHKEIEVKWLQPSDILTKKGASSSSLLWVLKQGHLQH